MVRASLVARRLAKEIKKVQRRFDMNRDALEVIEGPAGAPAYERSDVRELVNFTEGDLLQAIDRVREPGLVAMQDWVREEFRRLREELATSTGPVTAEIRPQPRVVAVVASLGPVPVADDGQAQTDGDCGPGGSLLNRIKKRIHRLFFLSKNQMLEIWVVAKSLFTHISASLCVYSETELAELEEEVGNREQSCPKPFHSFIFDDSRKKRRISRGYYFYEFYELKPEQRPPDCSSRKLRQMSERCSLDFICNDGPIACSLDPYEGRPCREEGGQ